MPARRSWRTTCTGYKAELVVYPDGYFSANNFSIAIRPTEGDCDDLLTWPFAIPHSVAVVDQREDGKNISKVIDPTKLGDGVSRYWFKRPGLATNKHDSYQLLNHVRDEVMLNIPHSHRKLREEWHCRHYRQGGQLVMLSFPFLETSLGRRDLLMTLRMA